MSDVDVIKTAPPVLTDYNAVLRRSYAAMFATFACAFIWAGMARIDSAVVSQGALDVDARRKTVQHLEGGIIAEILVKEGSVVQAGQVLLRLDETRNVANLDLYRKQQVIALAQETRLQAQLSESAELKFDAAVTKLEADPVVQAALNDQRIAFQSRRSKLLTGLAVLDSQATQVESDGSQAKSDREVAERQLKILQAELRPLEDLLKRGLVPLSKVSALQREEQQLQGAIDRADLTIGKSKERLTEVSGRKQQLVEEYRQEAATALVGVRKTLSDVQQQLVLASDSLQRVEIKAPIAGSVQALKYFTVGGVVRAGDAILDIVPAQATRIVRARVSPIDIDRLRLGQSVEVRLPQFQLYQSTQIHGTVRVISRDALTDDTSKQTYYAMEIAIDEHSIPPDIASKLVSGMICENIVATGERTVLEYLVAPILNRSATSLRER